MRPCVLLDRDGTVIRHVHYLNQAEQVELIPGVAAAIAKLNRVGFKVGLVTNQAVVAMGGCSLEELGRIHQRMEQLLRQESAHLDGIFFCPHHPEGKLEAFRMQCSCRKPEIGMVEEALKKFEGDRGSSWMVGDTTSDIQTAKNAKVSSILVSTGLAGLDKKYSIHPDFHFPDLAKAIDFILTKRAEYDH